MTTHLTASPAQTTAFNATPPPIAPSVTQTTTSSIIHALMPARRPLTLTTIMSAWTAQPVVSTALTITRARSAGTHRTCTPHRPEVTVLRTVQPHTLTIQTQTLATHVDRTAMNATMPHIVSNASALPTL